MPTIMRSRIVGLKKLQAAVEQAPGILASQNAIALHSSVDLVERVAIAHTPEGPGHFGYHLRDRFFTKVRVGLWRSVGIVGTNAPQGRWREFGTKAHDIGPRIAGGFLFMGARIGTYAAEVHHPGSKPRHTLRRALNSSRPSIRAFFVGATLRTAESMAVSGD
jgi:hypothetical protein